MEAQWRVEVLMIHPHPLWRSSPIVAINPQLPQRSYVTSGPSLPRLPRHITNTNTHTHTHTPAQRMAEPERRTCCDGSEVAMREEPIVCFYVREKCTDNRASANLSGSIKLRCCTWSASSTSGREYATHPRGDFFFSLKVSTVYSQLTKAQSQTS